MSSVEPIRETAEAARELQVPDEASLLETLRDMGRQVQEIVPDCVGLSLASKSHGVTFTLVASDEEVALLDAIQYLAGGPCVDAFEGERVLEVREDRLSPEDEWQLFARATSAVAVASSLTLPIVSQGRVTGTVNLYGASGNAFTGHHQQLADIFRAWAPGAVTNADLSFSTRAEAREAPNQLRAKINQAAAVVADSEHVTPDEARERIRDAAHRAGVPEVRLADELIRLRSPESGTG